MSHLPGVGQNFQDHPIIGGGLWEAPEPIPVRNNAAEANLFVKSRPELDTPDLHIWHVEAPYLSEVTGTPRRRERLVDQSRAWCARKAAASCG